MCKDSNKNVNRLYITFLTIEILLFRISSMVSFMIIKSIAETSYSGMFKVAPEEGSAFYVRAEYLPEGLLEKIDAGAEFDEADTDSLLDAGLTCAVELKAVSYLARAEQSRFGLTRKLIEKKYDKKYVEAAVTYLEGRGYLSDLRYATAWLNTRK